MAVDLTQELAELQRMFALVDAVDKAVNMPTLLEQFDALRELCIENPGLVKEDEEVKKWMINNCEWLAKNNKTL